MSENNDKRNMVELEEENFNEQPNISEPIAMDILGMAKEQSNRLVGITKVCVAMMIIFGIASYIAISYNNHKFLSYLEQYDFSGTIEQTGVYTFSDSDGNIISSDISAEDMRKILEVIDGESEDNSEKNEEKR